MPVRVQKSRDWTDLHYLQESTRERIREVFEVHFGPLRDARRAAAKWEKRSDTRGKQPRLVFIIGPESMGVLEIIEVIKERSNSGFWNAKIYMDGNLLNPTQLEPAILTCAVQEQPMIILLGDLDSVPRGIGGGFDNWENIVRSVVNESQKVAENTTIVWPCTSPDISNLSSDTIRKLRNQSQIIFVEPPRNVEAQEKWLKRISENPEYKQSAKIDMKKLTPYCEKLGYLEIETAFDHADDVAVSRNTNLTTDLILNELSKFVKIDYKAFDEAFIKLGHKAPEAPPPIHSWDEIIGLDVVKITFHIICDNINKGRGADFNTILLWGTPGCGKTFFAKVASDVPAPDGSRFVPIIKTGTQLIGEYIGWTEKKINAFFDEIEAAAAAAAAEKRPVFVFIDEADQLMVSRDAKIYESTVYDKAAVETLISRIGGFKSLNNVIFIMSVNFPNSIDDAVTRRFNYRIFIGPPNLEGYKRLWKQGLEKAAKEAKIDLKLSEDDYFKISKTTHGNYLPSNINGPQSIIQKIIENAQGRKIDFELVESIIKMHNPATDQMLIRRYRKRRSEIPDVFPITDRNRLQSFINEHKSELGLTATVDEILGIEERETSYPAFTDIVGMWFEKLNLYVVCERLLEDVKWSQNKSPILMLWGPPGTGKTFLMKALSNTMTTRKGKKFDFHLVEGGENITVEGMEKNFEKAESSAPSILFIDEAERLLPAMDFSPLKRDIVSRFLTKIQGYETEQTRVLVVLATNRPGEIDSRVWSRVYGCLYAPLPTMEDLPNLWKKSLERHALNLNIDKVDFDRLSKESEGISPRNIDDICSKISLAYSLEGKTEITTEDLISYIRKTPKNIGVRDCQEFADLHQEYTLNPVIDREKAQGILKNRKDLAELLGYTPPEGRVEPPKPPIEHGRKPGKKERPPQGEEKRPEIDFEWLKIERSPGISEISADWLQSRMGWEELTQLFKARLIIKKGGFLIRTDPIEFTYNQYIAEDVIRLANSIVSKHKIAEGMSYEIHVQIVDGESS